MAGVGAAARCTAAGIATGAAETSAAGAAAWTEAGEPATALAGMVLPIADGALAGVVAGRSPPRDWLITMQWAPARLLADVAAAAVRQVATVQGTGHGRRRSQQTGNPQ